MKFSLKSKNTNLEISITEKNEENTIVLSKTQKLIARATLVGLIVKDSFKESITDEDVIMNSAKWGALGALLGRDLKSGVSVFARVYIGTAIVNTVMELVANGKSIKEIEQFLVEETKED